MGAFHTGSGQRISLGASFSLITAFLFLQEGSFYYMEEWKQHSIFSFLYVSNYGRVKTIRSKNERLLVPDLVNGYLRIRIYINKKQFRLLLHRLVAELFVPNPDNKPFVNHLDANKLNAQSTNLEWCTSKENIYHSKQITKNGAVISSKRIKELYEFNNSLSLEEFVKLLLNNVN